MAQATRVADVRQSRYGGMAKTHLQHVVTACALNLLRSAAWLGWPATPSSAAITVQGAEPVVCRRLMQTQRKTL